MDAGAASSLTGTTEQLVSAAWAVWTRVWLAYQCCRRTPPAMSAAKIRVCTRQDRSDQRRWDGVLCMRRYLDVRDQKRSRTPLNRWYERRISKVPKDE